MKKNTTVLPVLTIAAAVLAVLSIVVFTLENQKNISNNNRQYLLDNTNQMAVLVDDSVFDFIEFIDQEGKITTPSAAYLRQVTANIIWMRCRGILG